MKRKNYIDRVYYIVFGVYFLLCFEMTVLILLLKASSAYFILGWIFLAITALICYFFYSRTYNFEDECIKIKMGFITRCIPYTSITNCYITHNNRLSYATSIKRIGLTLKDQKNDIYISPEKMDEILLLLRKSSDNKEVKPKTVTPAVKKTTTTKKTETKSAVKKAPAKKTTKKTTSAAKKTTTAKVATTKTAAKKPTAKQTRKTAAKKTSKGSK